MRPRHWVFLCVFKTTWVKDWKPLIWKQAGQWCEWPLETSIGHRDGQNLETLSPGTWRCKSFLQPASWKTWVVDAGNRFAEGNSEEEISFSKGLVWMPVSGKTTQKPGSPMTWVNWGDKCDCPNKRFARHMSLLASLWRKEEFCKINC